MARTFSVYPTLYILTKLASSGRNFLLYQRADKGSLQQWADAVDDQSYTFDNLLPYYQKSVNFTPPASSRFANATTKFNATAFSSTGGPLQVSYPAYAEPYATWAGAGFEDIGIPIADDFNSGTVMGSQWASTTIDPYTAFRSSSQTSFLNQSQARPNLKVFELTMAKKIVFNNTTAIGVEIDSGITLFANKEVIVSAGAFQSPQLLMVSGIGPAAVLEALNISVIADLPGVGQNLTDHIMFGPTYQILVETLGSLITNPASLLASLIYEYLPYATGPLTSGQTSYLAWEKVPRDLISNASAAALANIPASWPELEYLVSPDYAGNYSNTLTDAPANLNSYGALGVGLVAPLSRGEVTITSIDTSILPTVNPNWLAHPTDRDVAIAGYKRARAFFASDAIAPLLANATEAFPGPQVKTDAQILNAIRNGMQTLYHAACTCRMGRKGDSTAVVDTRARVFGVERLRVVDSSSFALLPPGHPQVSLYIFIFVLPSWSEMRFFPPTTSSQDTTDMSLQTESCVRLGREDCGRDQAWLIDNRFWTRF